MHWIATLLASASLASAQLIAYESFSGMPTGGGISGSGEDAVGWTQSSWQGAVAPYHSIGNQAPAMTYQITNGGLVSGGDRCVILSTAPEPTGETKAVTRSVPPLTSSFFISFLVRPLVSGTGSDMLIVELCSGSTRLGAISFSPDEVTGMFIISPEFGPSGGTSRGSATKLSVGDVYFVAIRVTRASPTQLSFSGYVNPSGSIPADAAFSLSTSWLSSSSPFNRLGLSCYSFDNGGPSSAIAIDEVRIGYTWNDVVPQTNTGTVVPTLSIAPAIAVNWQSKTNKSYQPQRSYDMTNWFNFGSTISGNGQQRVFLDSADQVPKSFYRVIER